MATNGNHSEAYDLSLFEPKQAKIVELKPNKKQLKIEQRRERRHAVLRVMATVAVAAIVVGVVGMMITVRVQLTELGSSITAYEKRLDELKSEHTRLEAALAETMSAQSVDEYAQSHGMTDIENGQIHYITRSEGDEVEAAEQQTHWWDAIIDAVTNIFS